VDGVVSLAKTYVETSGAISGSKVLDSLYETGSISEKRFSIHLGTVPILEFGTMNMSRAAGILTYI